MFIYLQINLNRLHILFPAYFKIFHCHAGPYGKSVSLFLHNYALNHQCSGENEARHRVTHDVTCWTTAELQLN